MAASDTPESLQKVIPGMEVSWAHFSDDRLHRYDLHRRVGESDKIVTFVMLNPSTADEVNNDPTVKRCIEYARGWGFGRLIVVNIFAYRSTAPGATT